MGDKNLPVRARLIALLALTISLSACNRTSQQNQTTSSTNPTGSSATQIAPAQNSFADLVSRVAPAVLTVAPQTPVSEALEVMAREDLNQLAVIREGHLAGVISRGNVLQLLRTRAELQV